jgi:hypothetical protein
VNCTSHAPVTNARDTNRRGLRLAGFALLLAPALLAAGCANANPQDRREETNPVALPQEIRDGLDRATVTYPLPLAGAKWSSVARLGGTDDSLYRLRGTNGRGRTIELEVTKAGRVIEVEESGVPLGEVPAPALEGLKARIPYANPDWVAAIYQAGHLLPVAYGFGGLNAEGAKVEVYITADGKTFLN